MTRLFFCVLFLFITSFAYSQVQQIESQLRKAEEQLLIIEQEKSNLATRLLNQGIDVQNNPSYIEANQQFKEKKKEVKTLKKAYKKATKNAQKLEQTQQSQAQTTPQNPVPAVGNKQPKTNNQIPTSSPTKIESQNHSIPPIGLHTILFQKFQTEVAKEYSEYINYVAKQMIEHPSLILHINAYTDNTESNSTSKQITEKMSLAVANEFYNIGIPSHRISIHSNGKKNTITSNNTILDHARNRRVELSFR